MMKTKEIAFAIVILSISLGKMVLAGGGSNQPDMRIHKTSLLKGCEPYGQGRVFDARMFVEVYSQAEALACIRKNFPSLLGFGEFTNFASYPTDSAVAIGCFTDTQRVGIFGKTPFGFLLHPLNLRGVRPPLCQAVESSEND